MKISTEFLERYNALRQTDDAYADNLKRFAEIDEPARSRSLDLLEQAYAQVYKIQEREAIEKLAVKIEAMPDDAQFFLCREFPTTGKAIQGYGNDGTVKQLKELVASWRDLAGRFMC